MRASQAVRIKTKLFQLVKQEGVIGCVIKKPLKIVQSSRTVGNKLRKWPANIFAGMRSIGLPLVFDLFV